MLWQEARGLLGFYRSMEEGGQHQADVGSATAAQVAGELRWWLVKQWDASIWECINEPDELDLLRAFLHVCLPSPPFSLNSKCKMTPKSRKAPFVKGYAILRLNRFSFVNSEAPSRV